MGIIDKGSKAYIEAVDAEATARDQELSLPADDETYSNARSKLHSSNSRKKPEEAKYFLEQNTLSMLERLHNIASDNLYSRLTNGERVKTPVPPGVQLAAITDYLDRAIGKPKTQVDITSGDRPIIIDSAMLQDELIQKPSIASIEAHSNTSSIESIDSMDSMVEVNGEAISKP